MRPTGLKNAPTTLHNHKALKKAQVYGDTSISLYVTPPIVMYVCSGNVEPATVQAYSNRVSSLKTYYKPLLEHGLHMNLDLCNH